MYRKILSSFMDGKSFQREKRAIKSKLLLLHMTRNLCICSGEVSEIMNCLEKLQDLRPRDHCLVSKHLMDNKYLISNCQFKTLWIMWLWVSSCPQEQLGSLDQVAFTVLKYCSNRLVLSASVIQKNTKPHSSKLPPALCEG